MALQIKKLQVRAKSVCCLFYVEIIPLGWTLCYQGSLFSYFTLFSHWTSLHKNCFLPNVCLVLSAHAAKRSPPTLHQSAREDSILLKMQSCEPLWCTFLWLVWSQGTLVFLLTNLFSLICELQQLQFSLGKTWQIVHSILLPKHLLKAHRIR